MRANNAFYGSKKQSKSYNLWILVIMKNLIMKINIFFTLFVGAYLYAMDVHNRPDNRLVALQIAHAAVALQEQSIPAAVRAKESNFKPKPKPQPSKQKRPLEKKHRIQQPR